MRSKVYVVVEFGGFYEDAWEHTIGVCSTSELADKLKAQIEEEHDPSNCVISEEDWESISDRLYEAEESRYEYEDTVSGIKGLFPEYSEEDIKQAMKLYGRMTLCTGHAKPISATSAIISTKVV